MAKKEENRAPQFSLQMMAGFDICEQIVLGSGNHSCASGSMQNKTGDQSTTRTDYFCRSIYNSDDTANRLFVKLINDSTVYRVEIPSGQWHHAYQNIETIYGTGTTHTEHNQASEAATLTLGYVRRGKVDGTGNHLS